MPKKLTPARCATLTAWMGECGWKVVAQEVLRFQEGHRHPPMDTCPTCGKSMPKPPGRKPSRQTRYKEAVMYDCMVLELIQMGGETEENIREAARRVEEKHKEKNKKKYGWDQSTIRNSYYTVRDALGRTPEGREDLEEHRSNLAKLLRPDN